MRRSLTIHNAMFFGGKMKKLHISQKNKMIFGICEGLSESTGIDVRLIRLAFIISVFFGGTGIMIYLILFAILPKGVENTDIIDVEIERDDAEDDHLKEKQYTKIYRIWKGRMIAGVCSGLADYLKWDVSIIRLLFIAMSFGAGVGIILYLLFWFLFPNED